MFLPVMFRPPPLHCSRLELSEGYFFALWVHILNSRQKHGSYPGVRAVMLGMFRSQHHCRGYMLSALGGNNTAKELQDRNQGNKYRSRSWGCSYMRLEYEAREGRVYWYWSTPVIWVTRTNNVLARTNKISLNTLLGSFLDTWALPV